MSYRLEFEQAVKPEGHFEATQVNNDTGARRKVRRWASREHKQDLEQRQQLQAAKAWKYWLEANWAWPLMESSASAEFPAAFTWIKVRPTIPEVQQQNREVAQGPPRQLEEKQEYSLGPDCNFSSSWWPEPIRSWPTTGLHLAAHPYSERCNFALHRLEPPKKAGCPSTAEELEWNVLESLWTKSSAGDLARSGTKLRAAFRIQNRGLIHGFAAHRQAMASRLAASADFVDGQSRASQLQVKLLWHGTKSVGKLLDICRDGFDRAHAQVCMHGKGCYFAVSTSYSHRYSCPVQLPSVNGRNLRAMLLAAVLVGEMVEGSNNMYPPPPKPHSKTGDRFENACDTLSNPSIFVTFKDHQALPVYVMLYETSSSPGV